MRCRLLSALTAVWVLLALPQGAPAAAATNPVAATVVTSSATAAHRSAPARSVTRHVLAISVDGFNVRALDKLGRSRTPNFHRLIRNGAATRNARTEVELTETLPNHTGMLTGRRIDRRHGGHGIDFNRDDGSTVQQHAGHRVDSVFSTLHRRDMSTALFASKPKFAIFARSWPRSVDRFTVKENNRALVRAARKDLIKHHRNFTFVHLSLPDRVGHAHRFMSPAYLTAVRKTDRRLGELMRTIRKHPRLRDHLTLVLTADHGGALGKRLHDERTRFANYRVPFVIWGAGAARGTDLYALNRDYRRPGRSRPGYRDRQPIRNGNVANVTLSLLGLPPVRGSQFGATHRLDAH